MKFLKKFETFNMDGDRSDSQSYPRFNQAINLKAKKYVDDVFSRGSGAELQEMCKEIGCDLPKEEIEVDQVKETAVEYFIENPERMRDFEGQFKQYPYASGDGIARTNNVGGTSYTNSPRIGESVEADEDGWIKVEINDSEMNLFSSEASLQNLIRNNKISLHDNEVWFKEGDDNTKKVLDVYFEIE